MARRLIQDTADSTAGSACGLTVSGIGRSRDWGTRRGSTAGNSQESTVGCRCYSGSPSVSRSHSVRQGPPPMTAARTSVSTEASSPVGSGTNRTPRNPPAKSPTTAHRTMRSDELTILISRRQIEVRFLTHWPSVNPCRYRGAYRSNRWMAFRYSSIETRTPPNRSAPPATLRSWVRPTA